MNTPRFTGEVSLATMRDRYALTLHQKAEGGKVVPQMFCLRNEGGTSTCYQCWDEGGIRGCIVLNHLIAAHTQI
jgi:hypothetical protein